MSEITLKDTSIPSSPPPCVCSKRKPVPEEKAKNKWPRNYSFSPLIINDDLKMGDMSCGNFYRNNHTFYQKYYDYNHYGMGSGYGF